MACSRKTLLSSLRRFLLALVSTLLALGFGEGLVRVLRSAPPVKIIELSSTDSAYQRSPNRLLGYELKANYRCNHPDLKNQYERTNVHGLRDKERTTKKPLGVRRVILLGDSVVEGFGTRESETISRQLEDLLIRENTEVLNMGVSGYCTRGEVELLEVKGLAFKPDVVVLVFVENDFLNSNQETVGLLSSGRPAIVKYLFAHSHLFRLAAVRFNLWQFGSDADPTQYNRQSIGENNVVVGLDRLSELSRQHGFTLLIAVWPRFTDTSAVDANFMPAGGDQLVIEQLGRMFRIPTVRLSQDFLKDISQRQSAVNPRLLYTIGDEMHPSAEGGRVAANSLKYHLEQLQAGALGTATVNKPEETTKFAEAAATALALGGGKQNRSAANNQYGMMLLKSGDAVAGIEYFKLALAEDKKNHIAQYNWGNALLGLDHKEEALVHYREAVRINPDYAEAHNNWGTTLLALGRIDEALAHFQEAVRINPDYAKAHLNLATALARLGRMDEALPHCQKAVQINPNSADAHLNLGTALGNMGQLQGAAEHFRQALRLQPDLTSARDNLRHVESLLQQKNGLPH
ncbi:MAG: tetratricopeptide repeat protein [Planctomycetes bacterium]|nr:tetratricopeptide repeat protein [Planctomycetota bacterium]